MLEYNPKSSNNKKKLHTHDIDCSENAQEAWSVANVNCVA